MAKNKAYVVWKGKEPGVYTSWSEAEKQVKGFEGARFKGFESLGEAQKAFLSAPPPIRAAAKPAPPKVKSAYVKPPLQDAWAVDAACSGNPGAMEYRGVDLRTKEELFHIGPVLGTNNIGEFLAIVHALAYQQKLGVSIPIYSDSVNAISWIKAKTARTKLARAVDTQQVWQLIDRAHIWLQNNRVTTQIIKWETDHWGENPADFGRK